MIEPMLTSQWFVAMSATSNGGEPDSEFKGLSLADKAKKAVDSGAVRFIPGKLGQYLQPMDEQHPRLVYLAPIVVGPSNPLHGTTTKAMCMSPAIRKKPKNKPAKQV